MRSALIVNAYAIGNWGDAAIVQGIIDTLRRHGIDQVTVAPVDWRTHEPEWRALGADRVVPPLVGLYEAPPVVARVRPLLFAYTVARYGGRRFRRSDPGATAYRADLVVAAGGGYLGGSKMGGNLLKLLNIRAAVRAGRPTIVAPMTVSPPSGRIGTLLRWALRGAVVFVRDGQSFDRLEALGIETLRAPDIAMRARDVLAAAGAAGGDTTVGGSGTIGWAPRGYRREHATWGNPRRAEERTHEAMQTVLESSDARLRLFAHVRAVGGDDDRLAVDRRLAAFPTPLRERIAVDPDPSTLRSAVARYAGLDVLITSRMHAALFAMACGTPALAIGYEPKVEGVMSDLGMADRVLPVDRDTPVAEVVARIEELRTPAARIRTIEAFNAAEPRFGSFDQALADATGAA